jgi:hypothetical protein
VHADRGLAARDRARERIADAQRSTGAVAPAPAPPPAPAAPEPAAEAEAAGEPAKQSWWRRAVNKITGKNPTVDVARTEVDERLDAIADELQSAGRLADRRAALAIMRKAYDGASSTELRAHAIADALRDSNAIRDGSHRDLLQLLRRALS